jgi:hypothetical protein
MPIKDITPSHHISSNTSITHFLSDKVKPGCDESRPVYAKPLLKPYKAFLIVDEELQMSCVGGIRPDEKLIMPDEELKMSCMQFIKDDVE